MLNEYQQVKKHFIKVNHALFLAVRREVILQVFPKEYKRALAEMAKEEAEQIKAELAGQETAVDVEEGKEGYKEDIMQDTPAHAMDQVRWVH